MISNILENASLLPRRLHIFDILILLKSIHLLFQKVENRHLNLVLHSRGYLPDFNVCLMSSEKSTADS